MLLRRSYCSNLSCLSKVFYRGLSTNNQNLKGVTLKAAESMKLYAKYNGGNTLIPAKFQVPVGDERWPEKMWGDNVGKRLHGLRLQYKRNLLPDADIEYLEQCGMEWEVRQKDPAYYIILAKAMREYKLNYGNTNVPLGFKVPLEGGGSWSFKYRGISLGRRVQVARNEYHYKKLDEYDVEMLEKAGIIWNAINSTSILKLLELLPIYKKLYGSTRIPRKWVVEEDSLFPSKYYGVDIGSILAKVRRAYREDRLNVVEMKELEDVGMEWVDPMAKYRETYVERLAKGLSIYKDLYGTSAVTKRFKVPENDCDWPEEFHGDNLGERVHTAKRAFLRNDLAEEDIKVLTNAGWKVPVITDNKDS